MVSKILLSDVYEQNLNFLIGAGASSGMLPTLQLKIKNAADEIQTIETLAKFFEDNGKEDLKTLLFMHYYSECILPAINLDPSNLSADQSVVVDNYKKLLQTILFTIGRRRGDDKRCNIFTTNYDGAFEIATENLLSNNRNFILNDGAIGFFEKYLHARNFNTVVSETGVFNKHRATIPQINLVHLHGSVYWEKIADNIKVSYLSENKNIFEMVDILDELLPFSEKISDENSLVGELDGLNTLGIDGDDFWSNYNKLPIVNPTKWKFNETVFDEHYYQMLRHLSYELERPNSTLITFGFSFADEHILKLVQRSLSNPTLQLFICCYNDTEKQAMVRYFADYNNVQMVVSDGPLDFGNFNANVFSSKNSEDAE